MGGTAAWERTIGNPKSVSFSYQGRGNYWDGFLGYDLDDDGVSDVKFKLSNSFEENVFIDNVVGGAVMYSRHIYFRRNIFAQPLNRWEIYIGKLLGLMIITKKTIPIIPSALITK